MKLPCCIALLFNFLCCSPLLAAERHISSMPPSSLFALVDKRLGQIELAITSDPVAITRGGYQRQAVILTAGAAAVRPNLLLWELDMTSPVLMNTQRLSPRILLGLNESYQFDKLLPAHLRAFENDLLHSHNLVQPLVTFKLLF
ncbi:hypothetical protein QWY82_00865 [Simiduia curdlanivorans]|uniref:Uncharacterized protein n=1 Tax=Simiduia curdlanivorans TaxID=1492769 RepID=A0ABV8V4P6_9GAMM|nr:hypothetical protein [Simiduia curdlanivorans]MDN3637345.1 hypothetical protein [Simiduia curdlanivorans]